MVIALANAIVKRGSPGLSIRCWVWRASRCAEDDPIDADRCNRRLGVQPPAKQPSWDSPLAHIAAEKIMVSC